jgi:hypothetical protein
MSAARQIGNFAHRARAPFFGLFVLLAGLLAGSAGAAPSQPVVVDPGSGIAISGFDPVAYFTDAAAKPGRADLEFRFSGAVWRFRNEGNRAAFADNPQVYAPQFGGYDPVAIARGVSVAGHPLFWLVSGQRLYLFYSDQARAEFIAAPQRFIEQAERKWPLVQTRLP